MNKREAEMQESLLRRKKKRSRWTADESEKAFIPGMPTVVPTGLSKEQEEQYLVQLQIEEISRRLRTGDLGIPPNPEDRSPSPEPIYNSEGKRLNTREYRTRKKLEEERHILIVKASALNTEYKPPADYKPPVIRVSDKVMIPQEEHPDINFVGLLIGPRGNTLKNLEKETGAKIIIRGKGSVKEGKIGRKDGQPLPGEDEPLHAYVTANNPENVKRAVEKIKEIIRQGIEVPEGQNDLRRQQLRELALLNGTLRENDGLSKLKQLQQAQSIVTNTIICTLCGGTGHIAQDCKQKRPGDTIRAAIQQQSAVDKAKMDSEYMSLMAELGEGPPPPKQQQEAPRPTYSSPPPPQPMQAIAAPPPWQQGGTPPHQGHQGHQSHQHQGHQGHHHQGHQGHHHQGHQGHQHQGHQHQGHQGHQGPPTNGNKPPTLMGLGQPQRPPNMSQPPPMVAPPPPMVSSAPAMPPPPWQQMASMAPSMPSASGPSVTSSNSYNQGMPPPLMPPPPPPPPTTSAPSYPWQQQQQPMGMPPPPPPSLTGSMPPWQQQPPIAPVPPPPPGNMMPWQQQAPPPPMSGPNGAPPPPPPHHNFNPIAPPPPPPGADHQQMGMSMHGGIPLGVPPPPPPQ